MATLREISDANEALARSLEALLAPECELAAVAPKVTGRVYVQTLSVGNWQCGSCALISGPLDKMCVMCGGPQTFM